MPAAMLSVLALTTWPCPLPDGGTSAELALESAGARGSMARLLVIPALLEEGNRMRRFTAEVLRRLSGAGITCFLPDLPGSNESLLPLATQTPASWQLAMRGAAAHFGASHVLSIRGGALLAPTSLPGWRYAPCTGAAQLRQLLRARIIASREAGVTETQEGLLARGRAEGLTLAGFALGAEFIAAFQACVPNAAAPHSDIGQEALGAGYDPGGAGLWLRAEPGENATQADALAAIITMGLRHGASA